MIAPKIKVFLMARTVSKFLKIFQSSPILFKQYVIHVKFSTISLINSINSAVKYLTVTEFKFSNSSVNVLKLNDI